MHINLLFSIDNRFVQQFKTTLFSIITNTPNTEFTVYVVQKEALHVNDEIQHFCEQFKVQYNPIIVGDLPTFKSAPVSKRYPETIYYRLLAHLYLPQTLDRILYLDADILCINDLKPLYNIEFDNQLYAAASHSFFPELPDILNQVRLGNYDADNYYNSGVLLMNLSKIRTVVSEKAIFNFIKSNNALLLLPDQDILNALYGAQIQAIPDEYYNYDTRYASLYETLSKGKYSLDWVMANTILLHFCGTDKPWKSSPKNKFSVLYKHYQHRMHRY